MKISTPHGKPGLFILIFLGLALFLPMIFEMFYTLPPGATVNYAQGTLLSETAPKKRGDYLKLGTDRERYACTSPEICRRTPATLPLASPRENMTDNPRASAGLSGLLP